MGKEITLEELAANSKATEKTPIPEKSSTKTEPKKPVIMNASQVEDNLIRAGKMKEHKDETVNAPLVDKAFKSMDRRIQETKDFYNDVVIPTVKKNMEEIALEKELAAIEGREPDLEGDISGITREDVEMAELMAGSNSPQDDIPTVDDDEFDFEEDDEDGYLVKLNDGVDADGLPPVKEAPKKYSNLGTNNNTEEEFEETNDMPNNIEEEVVVNKVEEIKEEPAVEEKKPVEVKKVEPVATTKTIASSVVEEDDEDRDLDNLINELDDSMNVVDDEEESTEEIRERFKKTFNSVKITSNPINFNEFKIRKSAVESSAVLSSITNHKSVKTSDWALFHSKKSITFSECSGPELDRLRKTISNSNAMNGVIASLRFVYDHIVDNNKPKFEVWTKLIRTEDIESLYFGIYKACYSNTNIIARICPTNTEELRKKNCGKTSLIDTPIMDMVKYGGENDDAEKIKAEFEKILQSDTTTETEEFESTLMQVSDDIVISYCPATLYSTFIQFSTLKPEITQKYSDVLDSMAYIDGFFQIDHETKELVPIQLQTWPKNFNKTVLHKLKFYTELLKSLTSDQYNVLIAKLGNLIQAPKVSYVYPEATCPECGAKIPEEAVDSILNLLFSRAQLAQIKSL